jgi:hypothetical protein
MKRPIESDYTSHVAYTRALEEYCDSLPQLAQEPVALEMDGKQLTLGEALDEAIAATERSGSRRLNTVLVAAKNALYTTPTAAQPAPVTSLQAIALGIIKGINDVKLTEQPAPVQEPKQCGLCGEAQPFTGTCGGGKENPKALCFTPPAQPAVPLTDELEALFTNIDHAISSGAWNVQKGSQTWEVIEEAKAAHGITKG